MWFVKLHIGLACTWQGRCKQKPGMFGNLACEQALGGMEGERKEEGLYAHLKFYCLPQIFDT